MYSVIEMYGDYEPWWFLDGWEDDIIEKRYFDDYYTALKYYKHRWLEMSEASPFYKSRSDLMTIFWDPADQRWCEESKYRPGYRKQNATEKHRICKIKVRAR